MDDFTKDNLKPILVDLFGDSVNSKIWSLKDPFKKNGFLDRHIGYALPPYLDGINLGLKDFKPCVLHDDTESGLNVIVNFLEKPKEGFEIKRNRVLSIEKYQKYVAE